MTIAGQDRPDFVLSAPTAGAWEILLDENHALPTGTFVQTGVVYVGAMQSVVLQLQLDTAQNTQVSVEWSQDGVHFNILTLGDYYLNSTVVNLNAQAVLAPYLRLGFENLPAGTINVNAQIIGVPSISSVGDILGPSVMSIFNLLIPNTGHTQPPMRLVKSGPAVFTLWQAVNLTQASVQWWDGANSTWQFLKMIQPPLGPGDYTESIILPTGDIRIDIDNTTGAAVTAVGSLVG